MQEGNFLKIKLLKGYIKDNFHFHAISVLIIIIGVFYLKDELQWFKEEQQIKILFYRWRNQNNK